MKSHKEAFKELVSLAGVAVDGDRPWDIQVKNEDFYGRVLRDGSLGLGESYMEGWWESQALDEFVAKVLKAGVAERVRANLATTLFFLGTIVFNRGRKSKSFEVGEAHYDLGNDLYEAMLDKRLTYSCGYWQRAKTLGEAQEAKLDLICKKVGLHAGMKVLDIGCGWGSFAKYAVEKYGAQIVGITVSKEQVALGRKLCRGLPVEIRLADYRDLGGQFDRVVSVGMFEHVGYKNYRTFMHVVRRLLRGDGLFLLQTIGGNRSTVSTDAWTHKYIFPNGMIPSLAQIGKAIEGFFIMEDWHNFGADYDTTLMAWFRNFNANWSRLRKKYGDRFYRMWKYYLLSSAGAFRARHLELWQIVLSPKGIPGGYRSFR